MNRLFVALWCWYVACVVAIWAIGHGEAAGDGYRPATFLVIHALVLLAVFTARFRVRNESSARAMRCICSAIGLPVVFSALGLVLPALHPEPFEWRWIEFDRAWLGVDVSVAAQRLASPWVVEILQWCYASFYAIPIVTLLAIWRARGGVALDSGLTVVVFGFLASYLGYCLWPTLPPYRYLDHGEALRGVWVADAIYRQLDVWEFHRCNCFPSGHTMLTCVSLALAWRDARRVFWCLLPIGCALVVSTIVLRYHYLIDVLVGLALVPPTLWFGRWLHASASRAPELQPRVAP